MPSPSDTVRLLAVLYSIAESVRDIQRKSAEVARQIADNEVADIGYRLAAAAIDAGMPAARAYGYAEEHSAVSKNVQRDIAELAERAGDVESGMDILIHIATVVPHRCPSHDIRSGRPALVLEG
jgi:methionine synthase I (cobalamin-dependent)